VVLYNIRISLHESGFLYLSSYKGSSIKDVHRPEGVNQMRTCTWALDWAVYHA